MLKAIKEVAKRRKIDNKCEVCYLKQEMFMIIIPMILLNLFKKTN